MYFSSSQFNETYLLLIKKSKFELSHNEWIKKIAYHFSNIVNKWINQINNVVKLLLYIRTNVNFLLNTITCRRVFNNRERALETKKVHYSGFCQTRVIILLLFTFHLISFFKQKNKRNDRHNKDRSVARNCSTLMTYRYYFSWNVKNHCLKLFVWKWKNQTRHHYRWKSLSLHL